MVAIINFTLLFLSGMFPADTIYQRNDMIVSYQNYSETDSVFFDNDAFKLLYFMDTVKTDDLNISENQVFNQEVSGIFFEFLLRQNVISKWSILNPNYNYSDYSYDYEEFLKKRMQKLQIYFKGRLLYSDLFDSYIFLINDRFKVFSCIMLNIKKNQILSIIELSMISLNSGGFGDSLYDTISLNDIGIFCKEFHYEVGDVEIDYEQNDEYFEKMFAKKILFSYFTIDQEGRLMFLSL